LINQSILFLTDNASLHRAQRRRKCVNDRDSSLMKRHNVIVTHQSTSNSVLECSFYCSNTPQKTPFKNAFKVAIKISFENVIKR